MKRILDRTFRYRPSFETDVRRTIAEFRRRERAQVDRPPADAKVTTLALARSRTDRKK